MLTSPSNEGGRLLLQPTAMADSLRNGLESMVLGAFCGFLKLASARVDGVSTACIVQILQTIRTPRGLRAIVFATKCKAFWVVYSAQYLSLVLGA